MKILPRASGLALLATLAMGSSALGARNADTSETDSAFATALGPDVDAAASAAIDAAFAARFDDSNIVSVPILPEDQPASQRTIAAFVGARDTGHGPLLLEILQALRFDAAGKERLENAYPEPLGVQCAGSLCALKADGDTARATIISSNPKLNGATIGVRNELAASFRLTGADKFLSVCDVDGIYFALGPFRKNLIGLTIDLTDLAQAKMLVYLAGAKTLPGCAP